MNSVSKTYKWEYLLILSLPISVVVNLLYDGWFSFLSLAIFFVLVPLLELILPSNHDNVSKDLEEKVANDKFYDVMLLISLPIQYGVLVFYLFQCSKNPTFNADWAGNTVAAGLMCGVVGINIGHELGHRENKWQRLVGELLLLSSLNTHFLPYHNYVHHKEVATPKDAATARLNEPLYIFWIRSHFSGYFYAWQVENRLSADARGTKYSLKNRMVVYTIWNVMLLVGIYLSLGWFAFVSFLIAAVIGILLLQTVNYIEHYGLLRKQNDQGRYERVRYWHSWNSDHIIGRLLLFNLSRHSDHHYKASKPYQILDSIENAPQMPTGYPGMMLLSFLPPIFFAIVNKKIKQFDYR
ncbi:MAG: alkane 1-monooxygenase [Crocinitomicaceae bacterium]|nr:alkane 1-monooxygenase [Crocinitomicaceae bacterium]